MKQILAFIVLLTASMASVAKPSTITDVLGREMTLELPAQRVIVGSYGEDYMAIGTVASYDKVVGMSKGIWEKWRPENWAMYVKHRPSLATLPDVGKVDTQTFSIEKVISLNPDVVLLAEWQYKGLGADIQRMESAGIKVVVVDYNAQTVARHIKSTLIIGQLTGQNERAKKIANEYQQAIQLVKDRVKQAQVAKPKIYIEFGFTGPDEYGYTYGKNMWGAMADIAQGDNIAAPYIEWWGHLNPEQVLASKPDVIIISGTEFGKNDTAVILGQNVDRKTTQERLKLYTKRAGWSSLPAVKNQRIYGIYHGACRTIMDAYMIQYIAKALYPELFNDIQPEQEYINFYHKYLPIKPEGTFAVSLSES